MTKKHILILSCRLEQIFRQTQRDLRRAQCELALTTAHSDRLTAGEENIRTGLSIIHEIQSVLQAREP
jgi:hypothetical protein